MQSLEQQIGTEYSQTTHSIVVAPWSCVCNETQAAQEEEEYRHLWVRLPKVYGALVYQDQLPSLIHALSRCGPIHDCVPLDLSGAFGVTLAGDTRAYEYTYRNILRNISGKANLAGEELATETMLVQGSCIGSLIGEKGRNLRDIKDASGAHVEVSPWEKNVMRKVVIIGTATSVPYARQLVNEAIKVVPIKVKRQAKKQGSKDECTLSPLMVLPAPLPIQPPQLPLDFQWDDFDQGQLWKEQFPPLPGSPECQLTAYSFPSIPLDIELSSPQQAPPGCSTAAPCSPEPSRPIAALALQRKVSNRTFSHLHRACWCLLKDRISLIHDIREGVNAMWEMRQQQALAVARISLRLGSKSKSWAYFVQDSDNVSCAEVQAATTSVTRIPDGLDHKLSPGAVSLTRVLRRASSMHDLLLGLAGGMSSPMSTLSCSGSFIWG